MKKLIAFIVLSTLFYKFYIESSKTNSSKKSIHINEDKAVITKLILEESKDEASIDTSNYKNSTLLTQSLDFKKTTEEIYSQNEPTHIYSFSKNVIKKLLRCEVTNCNINYDGEFYDKELSLPLALIERHLELLNMVSERGNIFAFNIDDIELPKLLELNSPGIYKQALKLSLNYAPDRKEVIKNAPLNNEKMYSIYLSTIEEDLQHSSEAQDIALDRLISNLKQNSGSDQVSNIEAFSQATFKEDNRKRYYQEVCELGNERLVMIANKKLQIDRSNQCN